MMVDDLHFEAVQLLRLEPRVDFNALRLEVNADRLVVELGDALVVGGRVEQALGLECCVCCSLRALPTAQQSRGQIWSKS